MFGVRFVFLHPTKQQYFFRFAFFAAGASVGVALHGGKFLMIDLLVVGRLFKHRVGD